MKKSNKFNFKTNQFIRFLIGLITVVLIAIMFPQLESVDTDYSIGMIWSKEDLIASFSFPIYKSESVYKREVEEAKNKVYPMFMLNEDKVTGKLNWLDSLNNFLLATLQIAYQTGESLLGGAE